MTIKNYSKQCLMISAGIMVLALLLSLLGMGINVGIDFSGDLDAQPLWGGGLLLVEQVEDLGPGKVGHEHHGFHRNLRGVTSLG